MYIDKFGLDRYAECVNVSNIDFKKWSNAVTLTPINIPGLERIFFDKNNDTVAITPKIPPSAKYNYSGWVDAEQRTFKARSAILKA